MKCFGVVGLGSIGKRHIANLRELHPNEKIFGVSSSGLNKKKPKEVNAIIEIEELIDYKPIYIIIASPASFHVKHSMGAIKSNIPLIIEKPLADNLKNGLYLKNTLKKFEKRIVSVGYCLRFLKSACAVKKLLSSNLLGNIYYVNANVGQYLPTWRKDINYENSVSARKDLGGGVLLELSHEIDYLQWLFGDLTLHHCNLKRSGEFNIDVEDIADLVLSNSKDVYINLHLDFIQKFPQRRCQIIAENGRVEWNLMLNEVKFYTSEGEQNIFSDLNKSSKNDMYLDMLNDFEKNLSNTDNNLATIDSAIKVLQIIESAKKIANGRNKY